MIIFGSHILGLGEHVTPASKQPLRLDTDTPRFFLSSSIIGDLILCITALFGKCNPNV